MSKYMTLTVEERRDLVRSLVVSSELPVSGWASMRDIRRDAAPSPSTIRDYWEDAMTSLNLFDSRYELDEPICWAHGMVVDSLERAHILSWQEGGSWNPSNFHLLCHVCHKMSEDLSGEEYWEWFLDRQVHVDRLFTYWMDYPSSTSLFTVRSKEMWEELPAEWKKGTLARREVPRVPNKWMDRWPGHR